MREEGQDYCDASTVALKLIPEEESELLVTMQV